MCAAQRYQTYQCYVGFQFQRKTWGFWAGWTCGPWKTFANHRCGWTQGYMAIEYVTSRKTSKRTDVYSFGVVALEIACGRKPVNEDLESSQVVMVDWVWELYGRGQVIEAADPKLCGYFDEEQMKCLMIVGLWCAHPNHVCRPSIQEAIHVLNFNAPLPSLPLELPEVTPPHLLPLPCGTSTSERSICT
ncbi:hypothetical protein M0R45_002176 [Rubus argutus]|uniref:Serine-threonine/tyrosine-protein kinase catalytic domain-containing protein n=1 Tax=Rubus argutus TaxID=59490 RepID=A0AAW1VTJ3_RUBAR